MIYDTLDDTSRGFTGEYGQLNVYDQKLKKYVLFLPLETLPSVVGSQNTVENDVTTSRVIGKIKGKMTIEDKEVTFLWHRDNLERLNQFVGKQLDFLVSYKDGTGWKFSGEITYKPDDSTSSEKTTGTLTIIASSAEDIATTDVRDLMAKTCVITNKSLPSDIIIDSKGTTGKTFTFPVTMSNPKAKLTCASTNSNITVQESEGTVTVTATGSTATTGIISLTPTVEGEASWVNYITVEVLGGAGV